MVDVRGWGDAVELGGVDERSVRVWVRQPGRSAARVELHVAGATPVTMTVPLSEEADWIGLAHLTLPAPAPEASFVCFVGERRIVGRLAPDPRSHSGITFGLASCNQPFVAGPIVAGPTGLHVAPQAGRIFSQMVNELHRAEARFVLLVGDQIYSETPGLSVRRKVPRSRPAPRDTTELLERYRQVYRASFGLPQVRALREAIPVYCTWDDHEILNDWGSRSAEPGAEAPYFAAASRAYQEYQHSRNPGATPGPPPYHYQFRHGDIGFLVFDSRGERSSAHGQVLGPAQWTALDHLLAPDYQPPLQTLFVVLTVPVAHVATWFIRATERLPWDVGPAARDRWNSSALRGQRDRLLWRLIDWQSAAPTRQVILLSGDVHAANAFTIRPRRGPGVLRQLTSSPLTTPIPPAVRWLTPAFVRGVNLFEPDFHFERHFVVTRHNFGVVRVEPLRAGGHAIDFTVHPGPQAQLHFEP